MSESPYALVKVAGSYHLVTFTSPGGERVALETVYTAVPNDDHVRISANRHERACLEAAGMEVALRNADAVEAYLVSLPDGLYSERIDPRWNDEDDLSRQRAEMVRHLGDALAYEDPYQATRWFDRSLGVTLTVGMVHLCEAYIPHVRGLVGDEGLRLEAARTMESKMAKDRLPANLLERWRKGTHDALQETLSVAP